MPLVGRVFWAPPVVCSPAVPFGLGPITPSELENGLEIGDTEIRFRRPRLKRVFCMSGSFGEFNKRSGL